MMKPIIVLSLTLWLTAGTGFTKDWKVFCMPEKHVDVGWSHLPMEALDQGYPGSVEEWQVFSLAQALFIRKHTAQYPVEAQYRWFFDNGWQLEQAKKFRPDLYPAMRQLVNQGEFGYNPIYANLHTVAISHEQLMRMMSYARVLEADGFRRTPLASASDAFSVGWGYASALASAGIKYFIKGTWYTGPSVRPGTTLVQPGPLFRWTGPDGKKVLFFYYDHYHAMGGNFGEPLSEEIVNKAVAKYEELAAAGKWPYDAFPLFGSEGDWGMPDMDSSNFIRKWNPAHPSVRLIMSTPEQFFDYIETNFAEKVPDAVSGGWGVSHDVEETTFIESGARARANDQVLLAAESLHAAMPPRLAPLLSPTALRHAWLKQVLYHEHSFGYLSTGPSPTSLRQYAWKNRLTEQVEETARTALGATLEALASQISSAGKRSFASFNSLSFPHTDVVEFALDEGAAAGSVKVVDAGTNQEVPSQIVDARGRRTMLVLVSEVPPVGYRSFRIESGAAAAGATAVKANAVERTLENEFYRLVLAPDGSIARLFDKELNVETFVAKSPHRGNQFIFKDDAWRDHSPASAEIEAENQGPVSASLKAVAVPVSIFPRSVQRYTLHAGLKRLDIENSFTKEPGTTASAETVFYAFPFDVPGGVFHLDIPGVVARYPDEFRAETAWAYMPAQSFAAASNDRVTMLLATREVPNVAFCAMRKFFAHERQPDLSNTTVFAMPLTKQSVNRHDNEFRGGTYTFHYAVTTRKGPFRDADALRFGWGFQRRLAVAPLRGPKGSLPAARGFLRMDAGEVLISALKQADDSRGLIVRLWNPSHRPATAKLSLPDVGIRAGLRTDLLERDLGGEYETSNGSVVIPCGAREFVTVRLLPGDGK
jgi:hypothetical protein